MAHVVMSTPFFSQKAHSFVFFLLFQHPILLWKCSHVCAEGEPLICDAAGWICARSREPVVRSAASEAIAIIAESSILISKEEATCTCDSGTILLVNCQTWDFFLPLWAPWDARCTRLNSRHRNGKTRATDIYHSRCHEKFHREKNLVQLFLLGFWHWGGLW
jgi:hypothetical protein